VGKKRRKDDAHDIGDSKPGDVGDSKGTLQDQGGTPMARIHNRREGELLPSDTYSGGSDETDTAGHSSDEEAVSKFCDGSRNTREPTDAADEWEAKFDERHLPNGETYEERRE
jgi:hypothetical protein